MCFYQVCVLFVFFNLGRDDLVACSDVCSVVQLVLAFARAMHSEINCYCYP
jgi:hypothetical protein